MKLALRLLLITALATSGGLFAMNEKNVWALYREIGKVINQQNKMEAQREYQKISSGLDAEELFESLKQINQKYSLGLDNVISNIEKGFANPFSGYKETITHTKYKQ